MNILNFWRLIDQFLLMEANKMFSCLGFDAR